MFDRRTFLSFAASSITASQLASAQQLSGKVALYANVGPDLTRYDVDVAGAELTRRETVTLPAGVQYAWPHASRRYLYVASSSSASGYGRAGTEHHVTAFRIDPAIGALKSARARMRLPTRPIHISTDIPSEHILVAFNNPSALRVYRINKDFTPGEEVMQRAPIDAGIFADQVRVTPDNRLVVLVTRGNEGTPIKPEDPGALKVFNYKDGMLTHEVSIAPNGGKDLARGISIFIQRSPGCMCRSRPKTRWTCFAWSRTGSILRSPIARTRSRSRNIRARQAAGTVHVHPNGRFLYGANRAEATTEYQENRCSRAAKTHRCLHNQSIHRRTHTSPAHRDRKRCTRARFTSIRVGGF